MMPVKIFCQEFIKNYSRTKTLTPFIVTGTRFFEFVSAGISK